MPGADIGLRAPDPTIATALKAQGYTTGQFGKYHSNACADHVEQHPRQVDFAEAKHRR